MTTVRTRRHSDPQRLKYIFKLFKLFFLQRRLRIVRISTHEQYKTFSSQQASHYHSIREIEKSLIPSFQREFAVDGLCFVCRQNVSFRVDYRFSWEPGIPNWRERLECPNCGLNNRMRAAIQLFEQECRPTQSSRMYITEQLTSVYSHLSRRHNHVTGSEFIGDKVPRGSLNDQGIRNEDISRLSFRDRQFDFILSFDVLEHVPNYQRALKECYRCLKPGGVFYFSVPFLKHLNEHEVRAKIDESGNIDHLHSPIYHGDPLNENGILCFQQFGWKLLDELRATGFSTANALLYWSLPYGYLGGEQVMFMAQKRQH